VIKRNKERPYYVPNREELINKADDFYFKMTPQLKVLRDYIIGICAGMKKSSPEVFINQKEGRIKRKKGLK